MMKNIENFGVQELSAREIRDTQGGILIVLCILLFAAGVAIGVGCVSGKPN